MTVAARTIALLGLLAILPAALYGVGRIGAAAALAVVNVCIVVASVYVATSEQVDVPIVGPRGG